MSGAYCCLPDLVSLRFQAKSLPLFRSNTSNHQMFGGIRSPFKGRGIDFEEVRAYQFGDDIRSIDWRVTARRMIPHTKIFREERERPVLVLLDQSISMFFGSKLNFKSVTAAEASAVIAWATIIHGDRIGAVIFNERELTEIRPRRSNKSLMHLFSQIETINHRLRLPTQTDNSTIHLTKALKHLRRVSHPGTQIFLISDFNHLNQEAEQQLAKLSRHCELMAIHVIDPMEKELPQPNQYLITNGIQRQTIDTRTLSLRQEYRQKQQDRYEHLVSQLQQYRIPIMSITTSEATGQQLLNLFGTRGSNHKNTVGDNKLTG